MFDRKSARLLNNNGAAQKIDRASAPRQEAELIDYHLDRGPLGQTGTFYVGIGLGIVFQAALITISIAMA